MNKIRILIVDDVKEILERLEKILSNIEDVDIIGTANNGKDEYEKILELQPDLVFTDNQMPELNGIDVIEKIRNECKEQNNIDFVMITGERSSELYSKLCKLNVYSIVNKPYDDEKIIEIIEKYKIEKEKIQEKNCLQESLPIVIQEKVTLWNRILKFLGFRK